MNQPIKCSVMYHNGTPIATFDIRTFASSQELADFNEFCKANLKKFEDETKKQNEKYKNAILNLEAEVEKNKRLITFLLYSKKVDEGKLPKNDAEEELMYHDIATLKGDPIEYNLEFLKIFEEVDTYYSVKDSTFKEGDKNVK